jgi:CheY-like chemotaxis protein
MANKKVLVVEDNPANMELFMDLLAVGGYESLAATTGEEALRLALVEIPGLVLLDIQLPGMDGLTVVKELRARTETQGIKVIALTAYAMSGDREKFLGEGFDGYLSKPVAIKEFLKVIGTYMPISS